MTVVVAYDGSEPAMRAVEYAIDEFPDQEITLLRVIEAADGSTEAGIKIIQEALKRAERESVSRVTEEVSNLLDERDIDVEIETAIGEPAREIVRYAEEHDTDVVIVGNHGRRGVTRVLLGSVAERVVRRAPTTVIVVR